MVYFGNSSDINPHSLHIQGLKAVLELKVLRVRARASHINTAKVGSSSSSPGSGSGPRPRLRRTSNLSLWADQALQDDVLQPGDGLLLCH